MQTVDVAVGVEHPSVLLEGGAGDCTATDEPTHLQQNPAPWATRALQAALVPGQGLCGVLLCVCVGGRWGGWIPLQLLPRTCLLCSSFLGMRGHRRCPFFRARECDPGSHVCPQLTSCTCPVLLAATAVATEGSPGILSVACCVTLSLCSTVALLLMDTEPTLPAGLLCSLRPPGVSVPRASCPSPWVPE